MDQADDVKAVSSDAASVVAEATGIDRIRYGVTVWKTLIRRRRVWTKKPDEADKAAVLVPAPQNPRNYFEDLVFTNLTGDPLQPVRYALYTVNPQEPSLTSEYQGPPEGIVEPEAMWQEITPPIRGVRRFHLEITAISDPFALTCPFDWELDPSFAEDACIVRVDIQAFGGLPNYHFQGSVVVHCPGMPDLTLPL